MPLPEGWLVEVLLDDEAGLTLVKRLSGLLGLPLGCIVEQASDVAACGRVRVRVHLRYIVLFLLL